MSNDHYVPQFYLRYFSPDQAEEASPRPESGSVRLINLAHRRFVPIASIKGQCKRAGFRDYKPGLETTLSQLEGLAASAIRSVIEADAPPEPQSPEHEALTAFTIIQRSRTLSAAENADKMFDRMFKVAYETDARIKGVDLSKYEIESRYPVAIPLKVAAERMLEVTNLGIHLIINEISEEFITSDHPVIAHNQYCEGIDYRGVLGWNCSGIQILLPISPRYLILSYDAAVYAVGARHDRRTSRVADIETIRNLNAFQILIARDNVYFRSDTMVASLQSQIERLAARRRSKRQVTVQTHAVAYRDDASELIHQFERMLPLKLCVTSVRIKRNMRRISVDRRADMFRGSKSLTYDRPDPGRSFPLTYTERRSFLD